MVLSDIKHLRRLGVRKDLLTTKKYGSISSSFDVGVNGLEMGGTVCRERMGGENLGIHFLIAQKKDFAIRFGGIALVGRYGQISGLEEVGVHSSLERGIHVANIMGDVAREVGWAHPGDPECWPEALGYYFLCSSYYWLGSTGNAGVTWGLSWQHFRMAREPRAKLRQQTGDRAVGAGAFRWDDSQVWGTFIS